MTQIGAPQLEGVLQAILRDPRPAVVAACPPDGLPHVLDDEQEMVAVLNELLHDGLLSEGIEINSSTGENKTLP